MEKRGQVTIFIILSIIIVAGIFSFFFWIKPTVFSQTGARVGFSGCIQDALEDSIDKLEKNAGFIQPTFSYPYQGENVQYLCYASDYYNTCSVLVPFIDKKFEEQLEMDLRDDVDSCYSDSLDELKSQGYDVVAGEVNYDVVLEPSYAKMQISAPTVVGTQSFARFNVKLETPIYEMIMIANSIVQYETAVGDADVDTISLYHPDYKIIKMKRDDGTTIYTIESRMYENKFQFASRSLAWPPGYDL